MRRITIGIDNGTTGTFAVIGPDGILFDEMPVKESLLGRAGKVINRVDHDKLRALLTAVDGHLIDSYAYVERPFTGKFLNAVLPGQRAFEAVLIVLEQIGIGYEVVDSREWQRPVLGNVSGSAELKKASLLRGSQMYPQFAQQIKNHGDADGLLIAHHFHNR